MKIDNFEFVCVNVGIGYAMVKCEVELDNGETIEVAENINKFCQVDCVDSNILHNEDRLTDEQKEEVLSAMSHWVSRSVDALDDYCSYMIKEYNINLDWGFVNGQLQIDGHDIDSNKLEEIMNTSGSDYFNIELN